MASIVRTLLAATASFAGTFSSVAARDRDFPYKLSDKTLAIEFAGNPRIPYAQCALLSAWAQRVRRPAQNAQRPEHLTSV